MKRNLPTFFIIVFASVGIFAIFNIIGLFLEYKKGQDIYSTVRDSYLEQESTYKAPDWYDGSFVDISSLQKENPETIGFLYFENDEVIRYPILYSADNEKYLKTTFTGERAKAGAIFMDKDNSVDFNDKRTILYGHNMKDGSMFGRLSKYKNSDYLENNRFFQIFLQEEVRRYEVISFSDEKIDSEEFLVIKEGEGEKELTLSTCSVKESLRFIVKARLVDTYYFERTDNGNRS